MVEEADEETSGEYIIWYPCNSDVTNSGCLDWEASDGEYPSSDLNDDLNGVDTNI